VSPEVDELLLSREQLESITAHAREDYPREACGLMAGRDGAVLRLYRMKNLDASPVSYRFDPSEQFSVMREMDRDGLEMVGIYHSHPEAPALPSQTDISRAFFPGTRELNFPGAAYLIVSLAAREPDIRAFRITPEAIEKVRLRIDG